MRRTYRSALVVLIAVVCGCGTDKDGAHPDAVDGSLYGEILSLVYDGLAVRS